MAASAHSPAAAAAAFSDSTKSLCSELTKLQRQSLQFPSSGFHGRLSIRPAASQGLNGSFKLSSSVSALNEVAVDGSVNAGAGTTSKVDPEPEKDEVQELSAKSQEETISSVMADVANLVKLVDSRDIVELELKHLDYELVIRKKEALAPPPAPAPQVVAAAPYPSYAPPPPPPVAAPAPAPAPTAQVPSAPAAAPPTPPASGSDLPRILSPMAGTFYKSPAPGEPAFVKVGDKVQKGQVICIVEAMKLMNEIEADQSGTVVEILAEDGKPVSVDTPLYLIKP